MIIHLSIGCALKSCFFSWHFILMSSLFSWYFILMSGASTMIYGTGIRSTFLRLRFLRSTISRLRFLRSTISRLRFLRSMIYCFSGNPVLFWNYGTFSVLYTQPWATNEPKTWPKVTKKGVFLMDGQSSTLMIPTSDAVV